MRVHHIEFSCRDVRLQVHNFCNNFGFAVYGRWRDGLNMRKEKTVLRRDSIFFVMHEDCEALCDYVVNVALEVDNVPDICKSVPMAYMLQDTVTLLDLDSNRETSYNDGPMNIEAPSLIKAAVIKSPIGKLNHTLIDKSNYKGPFLPEFTPSLDAGSANEYQHEKASVEHGIVGRNNEIGNGMNDCLALDHILFAVNTGTSLELMEWYSKCLQMSRCRVNNSEEKDGFRVETINSKGDKLGLKLTAMQYHFCAERIMKMTSKNRMENNDVKIVFGESLLGQGPNQIDTFLKENNGPGVQHVGLLSHNIFSSVQEWAAKDVKFIKPPKHYYNEINDKIQMIDETGLRNLLENHGVLLDVEDPEERAGDSKYLLQVFTKPIFSKETFFFELIQRHGATGFGAGNISALWRAVDAYLREQNKLD